MLFTRKNKSLAINDVTRSLFCEYSDKQLSNHVVFKEAYRALHEHNNEVAMSELKQLARSPISRNRIYAWNELRKLGVFPDAKYAKEVLGIVFEVSVSADSSKRLTNNVDYLAVYSDYFAQYINYSGYSTIWKPEQNGDYLNLDFKALLSISKMIVSVIDLWNEPRRTSLSNGYMRFSFLTPSGLLFGEGLFSVMANHFLSKDLLNQATAIMVKIANAKGIDKIKVY